jgi:hypothetical protein
MRCPHCKRRFKKIKIFGHTINVIEDPNLPEFEIQFAGKKEIMSKHYGVYIRGPFIIIKMPCGNTVTYEKPSDVPKKTTLCPCGNKDHWLIYYEEK